MKKIFVFGLLFTFLISTLYAHGEGVHQHMVREAYKLLKYSIGQDIREMMDHVGYNQEGNGQFNPGNLMVIGAYQEDHSDATNESYGFSGWLVSNTHFWEPDQGDNSTFYYLGNNYSNAYQKARKYIYGGYELRVPYPENGIIEAYTAPPNLFQFYKDGVIYYKGYYNILGQFIPRNRWHIASITFRNKVVWEIFGRICHLLGDMTVPAHVHNDPHPPTDLDTYESWMDNPSIYNQWTYQSAIVDGGLINPSQSSNPLKHLFYPTAQITGFFNTFDVDGNNVCGNNDSFSMYPGLSAKITELTNFYGGIAPTKNYAVALEYCANQTFTYGIRAMAGLLYWFAKECNLLPQPLVNVYLMGDFILYAGGIGDWYVRLDNGINPFAYSWQIMYLDGVGYLQTFESIKKEKEKKDKDKKKDGEVIIDAAPSNEWVPVGTNSPYFSKPHNPYDLRDFKLRCVVTDGSNTTKTSNEFYVDVVSYPPEFSIGLNGDNQGNLLLLEKEIEEVSISNSYTLNQNYPNPFNPTTRISYSVPEAGFVSVKVFDILGREVSNLVNEQKQVGNYEIEFDASGLPSGTYIYKIDSGKYQTIKKMLLVK